MNVNSEIMSSVSLMVLLSPSRHRGMCGSFIDEFISDKVGGEVKLLSHIGGGHYVSVTSGFRCVDFRKWFQPRDQKDPKPTRKGIALNLDQWVRMRKIVEAINNDHPVLAAALPCYVQDDHLATFECRECYPFLKLA